MTWIEWGTFVGVPLVLSMVLVVVIIQLAIVSSRVSRLEKRVHCHYKAINGVVEVMQGVHGYDAAASQDLSKRLVEDWSDD